VRALTRLWRGEVALGVAFWDWAVLGGLVVNLTTSALSLVLIMAGHPIAALIVGHALSVPYNVLVTVGVWRAADRHAENRRWAHVARFLTLSAMLILSVV
jgi:hypothetical protein